MTIMGRALVRSFKKWNQTSMFTHPFVLEYDRLKHEKCTLELGQYIFECAALNIVDKQYSNRKSLSDEDCGFVPPFDHDLSTYSLIIIFQHDHPGKGLSDGKAQGMFGIRSSWSDFLRQLYTDNLVCRCRPHCHQLNANKSRLVFNSPLSNRSFKLSKEKHSSHSIWHSIISTNDINN